jgi:malonyl CoA-acyl carrier protein transacylase
LPVYQNVTATAVSSQTEIKKPNHTIDCLKWTQSVQQMIADDGATLFTEVGPGKSIGWD